MVPNAPAKKKRFLETLGDSGHVSHAAASIGVDRKTAYRWRAADKGFADAWDAALDRGLDELERIAHQRAAESSDTLLIFLLKSKRRDRFGDHHQIEVSGSLAIDSLLLGEPDEAA